MGLDMYLEKEVYVGAYFEHREVKGVVDITSNGHKLDIPFGKISTIILQMGYWRKANHIHDWFVQVVQEGVDECQKAWVSIEQLRELKKACEEVLKNRDRASDILPTVEGFFFGGQEYDDYYMKDTEYTIKVVDECLKDEEGYYYYQSSW